MATLIVGIGFGDESKGGHTDFVVRLTRKPVTVVRFSGGAQAGHTVVPPDGRRHTFRQFGSGTFAGATTFLSRHMLVNPVTLRLEAQDLLEHGVLDPLKLVSIDRDALITTVYHVAANRLIETLRGDERHGSCGMGIGETVGDSLNYPEMAVRAHDLLDPVTLRRKLEFSRQRKLEQFRPWEPNSDNPHWAFISDADVEHQVKRYARLGKLFTLVDRDHLRRLQGELIFEGAQGVLLDQDYGFHPHTTWSKTTFDNALELLDEAGFDSEQARRIGVLRGYTTRHGAGPLPTEEASGFAPDLDNVTNHYQQHFRSGPFDAVLAQYAHRVVGRIDELVVTNLDKIQEARPRICTAYQSLQSLSVPTNPADQAQLTRTLFQAKPLYRELDSLLSLVEAIQAIMEVPVTWCSTGPGSGDKIPIKGSKK